MPLDLTFLLCSILIHETTVYILTWLPLLGILKRVSSFSISTWGDSDQPTRTSKCSLIGAPHWHRLQFRGSRLASISSLNKNLHAIDEIAAFLMHAKNQIMEFGTEEVSPRQLQIRTSKSMLSSHCRSNYRSVQIFHHGLQKLILAIQSLWLLC